VPPVNVCRKMDGIASRMITHGSADSSFAGVIPTAPTADAFTAGEQRETVESVGVADGVAASPCGGAGASSVFASAVDPAWCLMVEKLYATVSKKVMETVTENVVCNVVREMKQHNLPKDPKENVDLCEDDNDNAEHIPKAEAIVKVE